MNQIDQMAVFAAKDEAALDDFVRQFEPFILKTASVSVGRFITRTDDEWAVALGAFLHAIKEYSPDKGSFLAFARLIIKRKIVDFIRKSSKYAAEYTVAPDFFDDSDSDETATGIKKEINEKIISSGEETKKDLLYEIESANLLFNQYGFEFYDLINYTPRTRKTKDACTKAILYIIKNPAVIAQLKSAKLLPVKTIQKNTGLPQKILENYRRYIIAAIEILTGDYPYLAEYLRFDKEVNP